MRRSAIARAAVVLAILLCAGCGSDTVRVSGRLVQNGQPYDAPGLRNPEPDTFAIDFHGTVGGNKFLFAAAVKPDGTFTVPGSTGQGVPRGEYRIAVTHAGFMGAGGDRFKARYAAERTPLVVDITDSAVLTIDVGNGTVTK